MGVSEETNGFSQVMASRIVTCRKTQGAVVPEKRGGAWAIQRYGETGIRPLSCLFRRTQGWLKTT
jgi:hypothetical protein